jgi:hypothetical protein
MKEQLKIKKLHAEMQQKRNEGGSITLREHLATEYKDYNPSNPKQGMEKYFHELGINPSVMTVNQLLSFDDKDNRLLLSELILSALQYGLSEDDYVKELLAGSMPAKEASNIVQPYVNTKNMKAMQKKSKAVSPGANFEKDSFTVGQKQIGFSKFGKSLQIPYEVIQDVKLDTLATFLKGTGAVLFNDRLSYVIDLLIHGDGARDKDTGEIVDDSAAVIGVTTANALVYKDILRGAMRMSRLGRGPGNMVADESLMLDILDLDEYSKKVQGSEQTSLSIRGHITTPRNAFVHEDIGSGKVLLQAPKYGLVEYVKQGLMVETDKIINRQLQDTVVSMRVGYMNLFRDSRVIIDKSNAYASNKFPDWMSVKRPQ